MMNKIPPSKYYNIVNSGKLRCDNIWSSVIKIQHQITGFSNILNIQTIVHFQVHHT
jgi:hypothetical protein